ncbi:MAG: hypothetical protein ACQEXX_18640 [Bacillota bacterium]
MNSYAIRAYLFKASISFMFKIFLMMVVARLGKFFFSNLFEFIFSTQFWLMYILLLIGMCYKDYLDIKEYLEDRKTISEIKKEKFAYATLEAYAIEAAAFSEISKTKLDIFKSLSPIPLIVFLLGIYTNSNASINKEIPFFPPGILLGDLLMYLGIGIPVFYFYFVYSSFSSYKKHMRRTKDYKSEAIIAKAESEESSK